MQTSNEVISFHLNVHYMLITMISAREENVSERMNRVMKRKATTKAEMILWRTRKIHEQENAEK